MTADPARLGLALTLAELPQHVAWLIEGGRDVELQDISDPAVLEGDWRGVAQQARRHLQGHSGRLGIHGPFWQLHLAARDPAVRALVQARLMLGLDFAEAVGASHMVVHSPFDFFGHPLVAHRASLETDLGRAHETLAPLVRRADALDCTLVVENIADLNPAPLVTLVRSFDSPHVRLSVDVGHAHLMAARGAPPAQQWLREAGAQLGHVHLQDNDGSLDQHLAPGAGTLHWAGVLQALEDAPAETRLILEMKPDYIPQAVRWAEQVGPVMSGGRTTAASVPGLGERANEVLNH